MIPRAEAEPNPKLPLDATFWIPEEDDLTEEGFGFFRDTWLIVDVPVGEAETMLEKEAELVRLADSLARNEVEFDELGKALEDGHRDGVPERLSREPFISLIAPHLDDQGPPPLDGLELGVAGLVYTLACVGCFPAASCRSHPTNSWSHVPVVVFATDRQHADVLAKLVSDTACGFDIDPNRPDLLSVFAASIEDLMLLARTVLAHRAAFSHPEPQAT